jgi:hypothetical protein
MMFNMKPMYRNGVLLSAEEIKESPSYIGNLIIEDWFLNDEKVRRARLLDVSLLFAPLRDLVPPLCEAEVVAMDNNQMLVRGYCYVLDPECWMERRRKQCWVLRPPLGRSCI